MRIIRVASLATVLALGANPLQAQTTPKASTVFTQGFSVVLLLGEPQGSIPTDGLSAQARKALTDIREFLPYKGYRVLDTQWVAGADFGNSRGRIHGFDDQEYTFMIETTPKAIPSAPGTPEAALNRAHFKLLVENGLQLLVRNQNAPIGQTPIGGDGPVLDNSFNIKVGETVVVGTSRLQSDKALIVLLTAVPAGGRTGR
jgi:hypothetical protein